MPPSSGLRILLLLVGVSFALGNIVDQLSDSYEETLTIKRLKSHQIYSHFDFVVQTNGSTVRGSYELFPRIIDEIVEKYKIRDLQISLTQGFWRTSEWGLQPKPETPNGAQLIVLFDGDASKEVIDKRWASLVNSLNGIFCTSLMELVPSLTSSPHRFRNDVVEEHGGNIKNLRYGALGGETVCTENLTPWKRLLPCKQSGISKLLNPIRLYSSAFHSLSLRVRRTGEAGKGRRLEMTAAHLTDLPPPPRVMSWDLRKLFDRVINGQCSVAKKSSVLVAKEDLPDAQYSPEADESVEIADQQYLHYDLSKKPLDAVFNVHMQTKKRLRIESVPPTFFGLHSFISNVGLQNGKIRHRLTNAKDAKLPIQFTHMIPWFLRVYMHTIAIECEPLGEGVQDLNATISNRHYSLARDRQKPALIELEINLPAKSVCLMNVNYDTAFMRAQEFKPDANYGNYVPGAVVSFRSDRSNLVKDAALLKEDSDDVVFVHGEVLLVQMPTPDFSMPFNVLCLVSTVISILYGPMYSLSTKVLKPVFTESEVPSRSPLAVKLIMFVVRLFKGVIGKFKKTKKQEGEQPEAEREEAGDKKND
uniref:GPI transamidase component PIG-T n=1 Tax=Steinernema glaseri TaxID=37863 RepID=A0A1I7Y5F1_9BILA